MNNLSRSSNDDELDGAIKALLQKVFGVRPEHVNDDTRRGSLESWDSLGHLMLVEALREEFQIDIRPEQALDLDTVLDIKRVVLQMRPAG